MILLNKAFTRDAQAEIYFGEALNNEIMETTAKAI
jgi:hypothetical protein